MPVAGRRGMRERDDGPRANACAALATGQTRSDTALAIRVHERLGVGFDDGEGLGELLSGAELDELRVCRSGGDVSGPHVEGVARLVRLLAVGVANRDRPGQQVPPVWALAAVP